MNNNRTIQLPVRRQQFFDVFFLFLSSYEAWLGERVSNLKYKAHDIAAFSSFLSFFFWVSVSWD